MKQIGSFGLCGKSNGCVQDTLNILTEKGYDLMDRPIFIEEVQPLLLQTLSIFAKHLTLDQVYNLVGSDFLSIIAEEERHVNACFLSSEFCFVFDTQLGIIYQLQINETSEYLSKRKLHVFAKSNLEGELWLCTTSKQELLARLNNKFQIQL